MRLRTVLFSVVAILAACSPAVPPRAEDHHAIIAAVLEDQSISEAELRHYFRSHPPDESFLSRLFDDRLCVMARTAGSPRAFSSMTVTAYRPDGRSEQLEWDRPRRSFPIAASGWPQNLRPASLFSICPRGTLRLSNPRFEGSTARLFFEHSCGTFCSGGGEIILRKIRGRWEIEEKTSSWQS